jgi:N-acyl-D-aspartate/D-glutamate deacylase
VHQGVNLEAVVQCGHSRAPVGDPVKFKRSIVGYHPDVEIIWRTFDEYLSKLEKNDLGIDVTAFVGHGAIHRKVINESLHTPTEKNCRDFLVYCFSGPNLAL